MILQAVGKAAETEGLHTTCLVRGKKDRPVRQSQHFCAMPLECSHARRQTGEQGIGFAGRRQMHVGQSDFWRRHRPDGAAERISKELMAEADSEERATKIANPATDRRFLSYEPRMFALLPDIHRTAHRHQHVEFVERRNGLASVEFDRDHLVTVRGPKLSKNSRMFDVDMLEHENAHWSPRYPA